VRLTVGANLGFGAAYNKMINQARDWGADYFLVVNPDTYWGEESIVKLLSALEFDGDLGSVAPKVYVWDFAGEVATKIIDTCGIVKAPGLRFYDLGQGQIDKGQLDVAVIEGPSGCAAMLRLKALEAIQQGNEYFDELMFMYKEDCDLVYRLRLAGWGAELVSDAYVWHDRSASGLGHGWRAWWRAWRGQTPAVQRWSFHNQLILFYKFWRFENWASRLRLLGFAFLRLTYAAFFNRILWQEARQVWAVRQRIIKPKSYKS
jgi:GT2 family glycosyltransferase